MREDVKLQKDVLAELDFDPSVHAEKIGVTVSDGVVTLSGEVNSYYEKTAAEKAALRVSGVKAVAEELKVQLLPSFKRTDADIAEAAVRAIQWDVSIPNTVKVLVESGRVTLSGQVDWNFQKQAAYGSVSRLAGVKSVANRVTIKSQPQPKNIKKLIEKALQRSASEDASHIEVDAIDDTVILKGKVRSMAEIEDAKWAAWSAPGVLKVDNQLHVV